MTKEILEKLILLEDRINCLEEEVFNLKLHSHPPVDLGPAIQREICRQLGDL